MIVTIFSYVFIEVGRLCVFVYICVKRLLMIHERHTKIGNSQSYCASI